SRSASVASQERLRTDFNRMCRTEVRHRRKKEAAMLSRIHIYAASLGLLLAGPAVAVGQSSTAVMPDRASAAIKLPSYELMGFPISQHQYSILGSANIKEQSPSSHLRWPACQRLPIRWPSSRRDGEQ